MSEPAIVVESLTKHYGGRTVVDDVSFAVATGSVFALLGRNGAGKTTTVECIEGFRRPDTGRVRVLGVDPTSQRHRIAHHVGVMLQEGGAYPSATPREMLRLSSRLYARGAEVDALLELAGLEHVADARFRTLSGGEQQRVNLALALSGLPHVLFLDEPTAGMDVAGRRSTWSIVAGLRDKGVTVLLTTHNLEEAEQLADVVAVIHAGRIVAQDTPRLLVGGVDEVVVLTPATLDIAALAADLGVPVTTAGRGRYRVAAGPEVIPAVTAWCARNGIPVHGVTAQTRSLEDAFLELTQDDTS